MNVLPYLAFLLAAVMSSPTAKSPSANEPGACLGAICLDTGSFTEDSFVRRYGRGEVLNEGTTHCYVLPGGLFFAISADVHTDTARGISWAYVGSRPWLGCTKSARPRRTIPHIATPEGLRVGDPVSRVTTLYLHRPGFDVRQSAGAPQFTISAPCTSDCPLLLTEIAVENGRVISILVSAEE